MAAYNNSGNSRPDNYRPDNYSGRSGNSFGGTQCTVTDLRYKEIINITTGMRLGYVSDVLFETQTGRITALLAPGSVRFFGIFGKKEDYVIPWDCIKRIGDDIILAEPPEDFRNNRR